MKNITANIVILLILSSAGTLVMGNYQAETPPPEENFDAINLFPIEEPQDPYYPFIEWKIPIKYLRVAVHIFQPSQGHDFFQNKPEDLEFIKTTFDKVNELLANMPPLLPENSPEITSPHIKDSRIRVQLDSIYFYVDDYVHELFSQKGIVKKGAVHAHKNHIINNPDYTEIQKHHTLHIIIAGTHNTTGGQVSGIGNKNYILFKGWYNSFNQGQPYANYNTLAHEIGHSCGLHHHFGPNYCAQCKDLGCYPRGETNNIMALWPSELKSLSECQLGIIHRFLDGSHGNISHVVIK